MASKVGLQYTSISRQTFRKTLLLVSLSDVCVPPCEEVVIKTQTSASDLVPPDGSMDVKPKRYQYHLKFEML